MYECGAHPLLQSASVCNVSTRVEVGSVSTKTCAEFTFGYHVKDLRRVVRFRVCGKSIKVLMKQVLKSTCSSFPNICKGTNPSLVMDWYCFLPSIDLIYLLWNQPRDQVWYQLLVVLIIDPPSHLKPSYTITHTHDVMCVGYMDTELNAFEVWYTGQYACKVSV